MDKLFMIADDLTGALDASVCFASAGIKSCVGQGDYFLKSEDIAQCSVQVSVVESRHMSKTDAYNSVYDVVKKALGQGFTHIYKKTDSALRGNIGAELSAVLDASGGETVYFIPAYPEIHRITKNGVQYIDDSIPAAESVFAADPFNPVKHSCVADIIAETDGVACFQADPAGTEHPRGIAVFDAETQEDVHSAAGWIVSRADGRLLAGCAGFAKVLPEILNFERSGHSTTGLHGKLAVFCGSINPISLGQCRAAVENGAPHFSLLQNGVCADEEKTAAAIVDALQDHSITVFETGSDKIDLAEQEAVNCGRIIADKVSRVIRHVADRNMDATIFIIGGDTLIAFVKSLEIDTIIPLREILPGVVLSKYRYRGSWHFLLSKSGGFGEKDLLETVCAKLNTNF